MFYLCFSFLGVVCSMLCCGLDGTWCRALSLLASKSCGPFGMAWTFPLFPCFFVKPSPLLIFSQTPSIFHTLSSFTFAFCSSITIIFPISLLLSHSSPPSILAIHNILPHQHLSKSTLTNALTSPTLKIFSSSAFFHAKSQLSS